PSSVGIHAFLLVMVAKTWIAGTSPAMTGEESAGATMTERKSLPDRRPQRPRGGNDPLALQRDEGGAGDRAAVPPLRRVDPADHRDKHVVAKGRPAGIAGAGAGRAAAACGDPHHDAARGADRGQRHTPHLADGFRIAIDAEAVAGKHE